MNWGVLVLTLGIMVGCGSPPMRTARLLGEGKGLVISNSPMASQGRVPRRAGRSVSVDYAFLVENAGELTHTLLLGGARTRAGKLSFAAPCRVAGAAFAELLVVPGSRYRVSCEVTLNLDEVPLERIGDQMVELEVPMLVERKQGRITFGYLFRSEDAS